MTLYYNYNNNIINYEPESEPEPKILLNNIIYNLISEPEQPEQPEPEQPEPEQHESEQPEPEPEPDILNYFLDDTILELILESGFHNLI